MGGTEHARSVMGARRPAEPKRGTGRRVRVTLMFTDIVASTELLTAIGDDAWSVLLQWHDATLRRLFIRHGGQEVKQVGDGFFAVFGDTSDAIACALAIQQALSTSRRAGRLTPQVRIGVHEAEVTQTRGDFNGRGVHEAARIAALGEADEVVDQRADACPGVPRVRHPPAAHGDAARLPRAGRARLGGRGARRMNTRNVDPTDIHTAGIHKTEGATR